MIMHAGECEETEGPKRKREDEDVAGPAIEVFGSCPDGGLRLPCTGEGKDRDMAALALGTMLRYQHRRSADPLTSLCRLSAHRVQARQCGVRQGKIWIGAP